MVTLYSTCPPSHGMSASEYRARLTDVSRWAEQAGCRGLLVYADNSLVDPWVISQFIIDRTEFLRPLVAAQPVYMHPFNVARIVRTIRFTHGREVELNLVTGGFLKHLRALGCELDHDQRYERLAEYGKIVRGLLSSPRPFNHTGEHYVLKSAQAEPHSEVIADPVLFVSGSSKACQAVQSAVGATRLTYPRLISEYTGIELKGAGIRIVIIARDDSRTAWQEARRRFPVDHLGEQLHDFAAKTVESEWHRHLSEDALQAAGAGTPYWIYPFRSYNTFCPYLVGSYSEVGDLLRRYLALGVEAVILDVPAQEDDLQHALRAFKHAADETA